MAPCKNKDCVERRTSATDPICIQFGSCSACFKTESWRQKGAPSQPLSPGPLGVRARVPTPPSNPLPEWDQYRPEPVYTPHNPPPSVKPSKAAVSNLLSRCSSFSFSILRESLHYWLRPIESVQFRFDNFAPHFEGKCHFYFLIR